MSGNIRPVLVKLGGSLLTDKARVQAFRPARTLRLMRELALADPPMVLVYGAGSFGHPQVRRWRAHLTRSGPRQEHAVATVLESLRQLSVGVLRAADKAGLALAPVVLDGRGLNAAALREVRAALAANRIPLMHGTLVRVGSAWRVLGGDEIMAQLARRLRPSRALWATNVEGVYDRDPHGGRAFLLDTARAGRGGQRGKKSEGGRGADVTGRMEGKLAWAGQVAKVCPTWIVGGHRRGRLAQAVLGRHKGTRIFP